MIQFFFKKALEKRISKMRKILNFQRDVFISSHAAVGGFEEGRGLLGKKFDIIDESDRFGATTWELAEAELARLSLNTALKKGNIKREELEVLLAGDLENQCTASSSGLYSFGIPYIGLYSACSTVTEGLLLLSSLISSGLISKGAVTSSSHNAAAERQFRTPVEYGGQRTPTSQWTATASGSFILSSERGKAKITKALIPKAVDGLTTDATNMGAAMARAAHDSIYTYFSLSGEKPSDFDMIVTGDLGKYGSEILRELLKKSTPGADKIHTDCGVLLFNGDVQDCHAGASGCGCSASVLSSHFLPSVEKGTLKNILFLSTGALMSPMSVLQGENILGIAPVIKISSLIQ